VEEDKDDLHALLEHAAKLMVKAGYSAYGPVKIKVAGKEKSYGFLECLHEGQTWNPADGAWGRELEVRA